MSSESHLPPTLTQAVVPATLVQPDPGPARTGNGQGLPLILGRKSMLMGLAASVGVVVANAVPPSAQAAGSVKLIAAAQPTYLMKWAAFTAYLRGQQIVSPNNDVVSANAAHTSSAAFTTDSARWTLSSTFLRQDSVFRLGTAENPVTDPAAARPTGMPVVYWITATTPVNAANGDVISLPTTEGATGTQITGLCYTVDPRHIKSSVVLFPNARRTYFMRAVGSITGATKYRIWVGVASGNISIANYANKGVGILAMPTGPPRAVITATCPVSGVQTLAPSAAFDIAEGDWIALSCDNATASFGSGSDAGLQAMYAGLSASALFYPGPTLTDGVPFVAAKPFYVAAE